MMSICVILYLSTSYILLIFVLMIRLPPRSTRTDTLFPYTTLFRSIVAHPISPLGASIVNGALNSFRDKNLTPAQLAHQRTISPCVPRLAGQTRRPSHGTCLHRRLYPRGRVHENGKAQV